MVCESSSNQDEAYNTKRITSITYCYCSRQNEAMTLCMVITQAAGFISKSMMQANSKILKERSYDGIGKSKRCFNLKTAKC